MSYKVVRNGSGDVICYGPNDTNYEPTIAMGCVLAVEANLPSASLTATKAALLLRIKADANKITSDTIGELGNEYQKAKADADAFKAAGYTGTVPSSVSSWATAKGWTATAACDDILLAANGWLSAQDSIRANRLARTEAAKRCTTQAELDAVAAQWAAFRAEIRKQLKI